MLSFRSMSVAQQVAQSVGDNDGQSVFQTHPVLHTLLHNDGCPQYDIPKVVVAVSFRCRQLTWNQVLRYEEQLCLVVFSMVPGAPTSWYGKESTSVELSSFRYALFSS